MTPKLCFKENRNLNLITMSLPSQEYPSPLAGYDTTTPLPDQRNEDGKSFQNPQTGVLSPAYDKFVDPLDNGRRGGLLVPTRPSPICHKYRVISLTFTVIFTSTITKPISPNPNTPANSGSASAASSRNCASTPSGTDPSARTPLPCSR